MDQLVSLAGASTDAVVGRVVSVRGSRTTIELCAGGGGPSRVTVGAVLGVEVGKARLVGMITEVSAAALEDGSAVARATASIDLVGEIRLDDGAGPRFRRGLSAYPSIGDATSILPQEEIGLIYGPRSPRSIAIGHLYGDPDMAAHVDVDSLIARHFAILGSTGVGKSSGVAVILREILDVRRDLRIFMLDGHNEYGRCFGELASVINPRAAKLPFWLFNFEEIVDVVYGGRPGVDEELEILSELIPIAKSQYLQYKSTERLSLKRFDPRSTGYTVDTPVPYLLQDLISLIDERMGKLENRSSRMNYHRLIARIETIRNDPRYDFMFENANVGGDTMAELLNQLFRIEIKGKPIAVMQLAGLPVEVMDAVVSVLCRLAFDFGLWSDGAIPLLFVCEEAHRYASVDHTVGFAPTRRAISRIAKEGRKYGVFLGLVSQRPADLDPTILSQCATLLAMRMANDRDQALLRSAVSDESAALLDFIPSLATREVIGIGEGVALPTRLTFRTLPDDLLPRSEAVGSWSTQPGRSTGIEFVQDVVDRWRRAATERKPRLDDAAQAAPAPAPATAPAASALVSASARLEQAKYQLLRR